ncbi:RusA family crossover junction endodeoxyribonuclease [Megasphaera sp. CLA-AA-H81]|uniref:RusA family crossover junction endodeoxyribonuclease n=1 Tax=Megasphaera intestinihominis TaxID=3133159 RepID=A0ABV1CWA6_9FIRM
MTKKNSLQKTRYGLVQGKAYREYAKDALWKLKAQKKSIKPIGCAVTMTARYYMPNRKGWPDLFGLVQATADILESAGIIEDDGYIAQIDGSMIAGIDAEDPRVEITVSEITDLEFPLYELHPKLKKKLAEGNLKRLTKTRKKQHEAE